MTLHRIKIAFKTKDKKYIHVSIFAVNFDALIYLDRIRAIVDSLPGIVERSSYGTPGFFAGKRLFARLKEDGETLVVRTMEREKWMTARPAVYFVTPHYYNYSWMLVRLAKVPKKELKGLLLTAWRLQATKRLVREYEAFRPSPSRAKS
jgi:hypothetical protein